VEGAFSGFCDWLATERKEELALVMLLQHGFEGWMRFEFATWLRSTYHLSSESLGLEYKVGLDQRSTRGKPAWKQCDLWFTAGDGRYHYCELKAPLANKNRGKVLRGAGEDFWYMAHLRANAERAASGNAIVVGIDFADAEWQEAQQTARSASGLPEHVAPTGSGRIGKRVRWDVWTKVYRRPRRRPQAQDGR
jgi:hypothetical protein